jgi:hypothetical protein
MAARLASAVLASFLFCASHASGQTAAPGSEATVDWSFAAAVYFYRVPDDRNYAQPTFTADRDRVHIEARYNYEDLETGSLWAGYNMRGGGKVAWELTPMLGGVFGNTSGLAPAYKGSVSWWSLNLASEGEYVFDAVDASESFFYNWSELAFAPVAWGRVGLVTQHTRAYATDRDIQRGVLVGVGYKQVDSVIYVFNPDDSTPLVVVAVTVGF